MDIEPIKKERKIIEEKIVEKMLGDFKPAPWYELWFYLKPYWWFRDIKYWFKKRREKFIIGFPREESWDFRHASAKWILPRLKHFRKEVDSFPAKLIEEGELDTSHFLEGGSPDHEKNREERHKYGMEKWRGVLDKIIWSFENIDNEPDPLKPDDWDPRCKMIKYEDGSAEYQRLDDREWNFGPQEEHAKKIKEGLDLFAEHYYDLWY
tara:strand:- start:552 stop:1175 length:624 start_codon:yes stop_codon:yes gene_type:complete